MRLVGDGARAGRGLRRARAAAGPAVLGVLLVVGVHAPPQPSAGTPATSTMGSTHGATDCHPDTADEPPSAPSAARTRAVVRTPGGEVRVVSFERGWAVYLGRAPGTFLRVCQT